MIRAMLFSLALMLGAGTAFAQQPSCTFYKVNTSMLNISQEPGGDRYIDALYDGDVACVTKTESSKGADWAFIAHKFDSPNESTPVQGWAAMKSLQQITPSQAADLLTDTSPASASAKRSSVPPANTAAPPQSNAPAAAGNGPAAAPGPAQSATASANGGANAAAPVRPEDLLHFDQPIPFGPFPVNGHSIKEMIDSVPLFAPIEGLDENLWKKHCTNCHQWNKDRLCQQALTYVRQPRFVLRVPHPFGGTLKLALMRWAKSGCP